MNTLNYNRNLTVTREYDVIVAGAGPAGMAAAVSSARTGAKTALIEKLGMFGGNMISGHVGPLMGGVSKGTIVEEIHSMLGTWFHGPMHDLERSKNILLNWMQSANVEIILQTPIVDVIKNDSVIEGVVVSTKNGLEIFRGNTIIDATGDGTVAFLAGAEVMMGRDGDGLLQPVSLMYTLAGVNTDIALLCGGEHSETKYKDGKFVDFCIKMNEEGVLPKNVNVVRLYQSINKGEIIVNTTQENYINGLDYLDITKAEISLRSQMDSVNDFLRKYVPGYENSYVKDSADVLGVRETRRIKGEYILNDEDLLNGKRFKDVMVHDADFVIDIHNPNGGGQAEGIAVSVKPYDIPYRAFLPLNIDNLLTAGRCISGTHRAHASYRVMNICMAMGQAVGIAAALSATSRISPKELDYKRIQNELTALGVELFS